MHANARQETAFDYLKRMFASWRSRQALSQELSDLPSGERARLLADSRLSESDLRTILSSDGHEERQLPVLLDGCGVDPDALQRDDPQTMRDLLLVCAACTDARRCRHMQAEGAAAERIASFCPNAETILDLSRRAEAAGRKPL